MSTITRVGAFLLPSLIVGSVACGSGAGGDPANGDPNDAKSQDADGTDSVVPGDPCDKDGDGVKAVSCGGKDCDDGNPDVHPGAPDAVWTTEHLPSGGMPSLAIDAKGNLHVAYGSAGIAYMTNASGSWVSESVDPTLTTGMPSLSMALDSRGFAHIVWTIAPDYNLRHATNESGSWKIGPIDATLRVSDYAIAVDAKDGLHVAFQNRDTQAPGYAHSLPAEGGKWTLESIPYPQGYEIALAVDAAGKAHVLFHGAGLGPGPLEHATNASGSWVLEDAMEGDMGGHARTPTIAIDASGALHIAAQNGTDGGVRYAKKSGTTWSVEKIAGTKATYGRASLALDSHGTPFVAFPGASVMSCAQKGASGWNVGTCGGPGIGSVRVDAKGIAHLIFFALDAGLVHTQFTAPNGLDDDCDGYVDRLPKIDAGKGTGTLGDAEAHDLCKWSITMLGGEGASHTCPTGTVTTTTTDRCLATRRMCDTVQHFESCVLALAADTCALPTLPSACSACRSGVDPARTIAEFTATDKDNYCAWSSAIMGGEGHTTTCSDGTVTVQTVSKCVDAMGKLATCRVKASDAEACMLSMAADPCKAPFTTAACAGMRLCMGI